MPTTLTLKNIPDEVYMRLRAERLIEGEPDWHAPILWRSEFRNILAGYLRRKTLSFD